MNAKCFFLNEEIYASPAVSLLLACLGESPVIRVNFLRSTILSREKKFTFRSTEGCSIPKTLKNFWKMFSVPSISSTGRL